MVSKHCWFRQELTFTRDGGRRSSNLTPSAQASSGLKEKPVLRRKGKKGRMVSKECNQFEALERTDVKNRKGRTLLRRSPR